MSHTPRKKRPQPFTAVWEFRVKPGKQRAFEKAYGPEGHWVQLFRNSRDYLGTELIRDRELRLRYVTLDHWSSRQAYLRFKKQHRQAYQALDAECEALTTEEKQIGEFDRLESQEDNSSLAAAACDRLRSCPELAQGALPRSPLSGQKRARATEHPPYSASVVRVRPATAADTARMIALERDSHSAAHWSEPAYGRLFSTDLPTRIALVVEDPAARVQGFAVARVVGDEVEIENIVVDRKRRHQGLGSQLMEKLMERSRSYNAARLFLEVRESNPAARALYEKCGFVLSGRRRAYYTHPSEDAVLYARKL